jgi:hypothetical protein
MEAKTAPELIYWLLKNDPMGWESGNGRLTHITTRIAIDWCYGTWRLYNVWYSISAGPKVYPEKGELSLIKKGIKLYEAFKCQKMLKDSRATAHTQNNLIVQKIVEWSIGNGFMKQTE